MFDVRHTAVILFQFLTSSYPLSYNFIQYFLQQTQVLKYETGEERARDAGKPESWQKQRENSVKTQTCTDTQIRHVTALV